MMTPAFRRVHYKPFLCIAILFGVTPFVSHAQNSSLVTSGMGGGASSTARMTAQMSQVQNRADAVETCGNKAKIYGPSFGGAKDADNCVTGIHLTTGGDVGIGTTGPSAKLDVVGNIEASGSLSNISNIKIGDVGHGTGWPGITNAALGGNGQYALIQNAAGLTYLNSASGQPLGFRINNVDHMHLTAGGNFGIGTTSPGYKLHVNGTGRVNSTFYAGGNATFGSNVTVTGSTTSQSYYHTSDRRLKDNIAPLANSAELIMQLKPVSYTWKTDKSKSMGFIAQDIEQVIPEAVSESQIGFKAVDYDLLAAPIVAMLQSQQEQLQAQDAEIQQLKKALAALKGDGGN